MCYSPSAHNSSHRPHMYTMKGYLQRLRFYDYNVTIIWTSRVDHGPRGHTPPGKVKHNKPIWLISRV